MFAVIALVGSLGHTSNLSAQAARDMKDEHRKTRIRLGLDPSKGRAGDPLSDDDEEILLRVPLEPHFARMYEEGLTESLSAGVWTDAQVETLKRRHYVSCVIIQRRSAKGR